MALIRPFRAVRPAPDDAEKIAALPYDVMNTEEARSMAEGNPLSFLHIDRAEIDLPADVDPYDTIVYEKAADNLRNMIRNSHFIQDDMPCLYLYRLIRNGKTQTGLAATVSVDEYKRGIIKKHELTRADKELDRINHVRATCAHTGPIFLTYRKDDAISEIADGIKDNTSPLYDFTSDDGVTHTVWKIDDADIIEDLKAAFSRIPALYIADGHHRNASASAVASEMAAANADHTGNEGYNFYLAVLFPDEELTILDYNRVVKDLAGMSEDEFLKAVGRSFHLTEVSGADDAKPKRAAEFGMYLAGKWYTLRPVLPLSDDPIKSLDVSVLQDRLLTPILGIGDVRTDDRIDFVGGIRGQEELSRRVDSGEMTVAFSMFPTSVRQLMDIADNDMIMPPKSTWFEPKLRSGLLIHMLDD